MCTMHAADSEVVAETAGLLRRAHGCTTSIIAGCSGSVHNVERSIGGGSAAPCFAEARWEVSGAVLRG